MAPQCHGPFTPGNEFLVVVDDFLDSGNHFLALVNDFLAPGSRSLAPDNHFLDVVDDFLGAGNHFLVVGNDAAKVELNISEIWPDAGSFNIE